MDLNPQQFGKHAFTVHLPEETRQQMLDAASAGQRHAEMVDHAHRTPTNLGDKHDLTHHLLTAHEWDDHDMLRNSHWRDVDHLVRPSNDDRRMTHHELRRIHDDEHATQDMPGVTMGDSHFHGA